MGRKCLVVDCATKKSQLTCYGEMHDEEFHPRFACFIEKQRSQHCTVAEDDGREQNPQYRKLLRLQTEQQMH